MIDAILSHTFNGADLALILAALAVAILGECYDARRNAARDAEKVNQ